MITMSALRQLVPALRLWLVLTVVLGLLYPLAFVLLGAFMPGRAQGSLIEAADGRVVGSSLLGQAFDQPQYFWPRASVSGYDALASGGSNLGPTNPELVAAVETRRAALATANGVPAEDLPADALTASASGLDPDISPEYAAVQVARVATARGLDEPIVRDLVTAHTDGRALGFLGDPTVNVLELNLALDALPGR